MTNYVDSGKLSRDTTSSALLNKDSNALAEYKDRKRTKGEINSLKGEINSLKENNNHLLDRVSRLEAEIDELKRLYKEKV